MQEIILTIIRALGVVLGYAALYLVKAYFVPWLRDKQLYGLVSRFVRAAEKLYATGELGGGKRKRDYVVGLLRARGIEPTAETMALIEAAVEELDRLGGKVAEALTEESDG